MSERLNKVHLIICTIAATIVAIGFIIIHIYDETHGLLLMAMWVSIAIVLFYFIGHVARTFLINRVFMESDDENKNEGEIAEINESDEEIVVSIDNKDDELENTMLEMPNTDSDVIEDDFMMEEELI